MRVHLFVALITFVTGLTFTQAINLASLQRHLRHAQNVNTAPMMAVYVAGLVLMVAAPCVAIVGVFR